MKLDNFVHEIAAHFGNRLTHFSRAMEINHSTVVEWAKKGIIPTWRVHEIKEAAKKLPKADRDKIAALLKANIE